MSYHNGPRIVTNGLVLYLDAGSSKSYPGSGTTWTDLSGNNNNGTLINGPTYSSGNKGSIVFDGINDYIIINSSISLYTNTEVTVTSVVRPTNIGSNASRLLDTNAVSGPDHIGASISLKIGTTSPFQDISFFISGSSTATEVRKTTSIITSTSQVYIISARWRSLDGSASIFVNGVEASYASSATFTGTANNLINNLFIGFLPKYNIYANQTVYSTSIYNRFLSNNEIIQNYNALKGRYNL